MPSIDIDGMHVTYDDTGTGLPIVFIPGLTGSKDWFRFQMSGLRGNYRIISYDVRQAKTIGSYTLDLLTEDLARLLAALKVHSAVIAGVSFGGMIALKFAQMHRDHTDGLVLMSAFPNLPDVPGETIIDWMSPGEVRAESRFQAFLRRLLGRKAPPPPEDVDDTSWLATHSEILTTSTLEARISLAQKFDATEWLESIDAPTLVIVGANEHEPFLMGAQVLYERIPDASLEVIEDCDHFCFFTRHDIVNSAIDEFVRDRLTSL